MMIIVREIFLHMGLFFAIEAIFENVPQGKKNVLKHKDGSEQQPSKSACHSSLYDPLLETRSWP
jgi:hypothetical protein